MKLKRFILVALLLVNNQTRAEEITSIKYFVKNNLEKIYNSSLPTKENSIYHKNINNWVLSEFYLRIEGQLSFQIPMILGIAISPNIEFVFKKPITNIKMQ